VKSRALAATLIAAGAMHASAADLRDPMRPPSAPAAVISRPDAPPAMQLQAVIGTGESRIAIVNGKVVRVGDRIEGALIGEISADHLVYTRGGKQLVASLSNTKLSVRTTRTLQAGQP
jgi:MSHA biogenesis protein MshK